MLASLRHSLRPLGAGVSMLIIGIAILSIPLSVAGELELSPAQTIGWIMALYGVAGVISLVLLVRYRQPLLLTGNVFVLIFLAQLGDRLSWAELVGASMVAGALVLVLGPLGLTDRLAEWLPAPIVFGLLAGAVLPFFVDLFTELGEARVLVGGTLVAYVLGLRFLQPRLPAILPALLVGAVLAGLGFGGGMSAPTEFVWPAPALTAPAFSLRAIVTATPVLVVLIAVQANVPSVVFLRSQGFEPPERVLTAVSGFGTLVGSLLGPLGLSLSLPATAICSGPDAGDHALRYRSIYVAAGGGIAIALLAGVATELANLVPGAFLAAMVGLAVFGVLSTAIQRIAQGPLLIGPVFAFGIALSDLMLFGLDPFFWALAGGAVMSLLLEREGWAALRAGQPAPDA